MRRAAVAFFFYRVFPSFSLYFLLSLSLSLSRDAPIPNVTPVRFCPQVNLRGGGATSRAAEDVGGVVVQTARDRRAGTANSRPGRREFASDVDQRKPAVGAEQATLQR